MGEKWNVTSIRFGSAKRRPDKEVVAGGYGFVFLGDSMEGR
jgi:hypothetical protein